MLRAIGEGAHPRLYSGTKKKGTDSSILDSFPPLLLCFIPSLCLEEFLRHSHLSILELLKMSIEGI